MNISLGFANTLSNGDVFLTWKPVPVTITATAVPGGTNTVSVAVTSTGSVGLSFRTALTAQPVNALNVTLSGPNFTATVFVSGRFGQTSIVKNDAEVTATSTTPPASAKKKVSVRIRRDANKLSPIERDRFLRAYAELNNQGNGLYQTFRDMHTSVTSSNIHGGPQFLPWHRGFVLDIERELQRLDPMVTMPYWRFDVPAPNVFNRNFMGGVVGGSIDIAATNPLIAWRTDGVAGIQRLGTSNPNNILSESLTLALGNSFTGFAGMEGNPHGSAHVSFGGFISNIGQAVRDPLFFLLHCNVDRLWAKWQRMLNRYNATSTTTYPLQGISPNPNDVARRVNDQMWPWDGIITGQRPPTAPGGTMPSSVFTAAPGNQPRVGSMIDYQGKINVANWLAFDYDDVPF